MTLGLRNGIRSAQGFVLGVSRPAARFEEPGDTNPSSSSDNPGIEAPSVSADTPEGSADTPSESSDDSSSTVTSTLSYTTVATECVETFGQKLADYIPWQGAWGRGFQS